MATFNVKAIVEFEYILVLNPMMSNIENGVPFYFSTPEDAKRFYDNEKVEPYSEEGPDLFDGGRKTYYKNFRKGGPLEMLNPLMEGEWENPNHYGHGLHEAIKSITGLEKLDKLY